MDEEIGGHRQKSAYICDAIEKKLSSSQEYNAQTPNQKLVRIAHDDELPEFVRRAAKSLNVCDSSCQACPS
jgi:hypothetical protein